MNGEKAGEKIKLTGFDAKNRHSLSAAERDKQ
jgi:hypothetical protein